MKAGLEFLKDDLLRMISEFHCRGQSSKEIQATSITLYFACLTKNEKKEELMPKVANPVELEGL